VRPVGLCGQTGALSQGAAPRRRVADGLPQPGSAASRNILQRQDNEYRTLPRRQSCSAWPAHCQECKRLHEEQTGACPSCVLTLLEGPKQCGACDTLDPSIDVAGAIGRTSHITGAMPSPTMLDLAELNTSSARTDDALAIAATCPGMAWPLTPVLPKFSRPRSSAGRRQASPRLSASCVAGLALE